MTKKMKFWLRHKLLKVTLLLRLRPYLHSSISFFTILASQAPLFGDDLAQILNSDTQQSAVFGGPSRSAAVDTWSDEE